ncbi:hypothetical protein [Streptococcus himalayensis]|uniref:Uncharacterized protein n=1 Tax=Streptococcus himalayensis TaxID=1888195 RepID=A0A917EEJ4_9STRE|nr:hypothetical protein [Streptococcus himalayensis]GGE29001.1 hypothetical protein GCM10011510_07850 [Streptococcus himalayensis]
MEKFENIEVYELEQVYGGDNYHSFLHTDTLWAKFEEWLTHPHGNPAPQPICYEYGPAYPAPVLPCR